MLTAAVALAMSALLLLLLSCGARAEGELPTVFVTNDNCPDYTWGYTEEETRRAFADIVAGHLDEMTRTDGWPADLRDRYNMAVTQEALCFVERYPEREAELIRRVREGRVWISPFLCNSLWGFGSVEGFLRGFYPARRLEAEWGVDCFSYAEHIEQPAMPWGVPTLLAGCGVRWLSVPFYAYDSDFAHLQNPPVFDCEGPDGSRVRVVMDPYACNRWHYTRFRALRDDPGTFVRERLPHLKGRRPAYGSEAVLVSGTHGDISPDSGRQARELCEAIAKAAEALAGRVRVVNAILPDFCRALDVDDARHRFVRPLRGSFGHSWDSWPVSLARYVADMREAERRFLAAEALLVAAGVSGAAWERSQDKHRRGEWLLAMLSDHAWNGTDDENRHHNAELRRSWAAELLQVAGDLTAAGWQAMAADGDEVVRPHGAARGFAVFNPTSVPRSAPVSLPALDGIESARVGQSEVAVQRVHGYTEDRLCLLTPVLPGFSLLPVELLTSPPPSGPCALMTAEATLESPFYLLRVDPATGGLASLVHKATGAELVDAGSGHSLGQTSYHDGTDRPISDVHCRLTDEGPVLARIEATMLIGDAAVRNAWTLYADLDRVDLDVHVSKPPSTREQRLCHHFPVLRADARLHVETPAAVVRPYPKPDGDLLPGADPRFCPVQGLVDVSLPEGPGVTIAPLDSFLLRMDLGGLVFEALGNDQNHREIVQDQGGESEFIFRYRLQAHAAAYDGSRALAWSRAAAAPLLLTAAKLRPSIAPVSVDPSRAVTTCLKPAADGRGFIVRLWETKGAGGPVELHVADERRVMATDLVERDKGDLPMAAGVVSVPIRPLGLSAVRVVGADG